MRGTGVPRRCPLRPAGRAVPPQTGRRHIDHVFGISESRLGMRVHRRQFAQEQVDGPPGRVGHRRQPCGTPWPASRASASADRPRRSRSIGSATGRSRPAARPRLGHRGIGGGGVSEATAEPASATDSRTALPGRRAGSRLATGGWSRRGGRGCPAKAPADREQQGAAARHRHGRTAARTRTVLRRGRAVIRRRDAGGAGRQQARAAVGAEGGRGPFLAGRKEGRQLARCRRGRAGSGVQPLLESVLAVRVIHAGFLPGRPSGSSARRSRREPCLGVAAVPGSPAGHGAARS